MWDKEKILSPHEELNLNNKLVEWKVPIDGMGIDDASLKDKFLFYSFVPQTVVPRFSKLSRCEESLQTAICCLECLEKKVSSDWFGCVLVISLYLAKEFLELVT